MIDFKQVTEEIFAGEERLLKQQKALQNTEKSLCEHIKILDDACKPICLRGIEIYNFRHALKIAPDSIKISFNLKEYTLSLLVELTWITGNEPDEELEDDDVIQIQSELGQYINKLLKGALIPFTFNKLSVPNNYYMK